MENNFKNNFNKNQFDKIKQTIKNNSIEMKNIYDNIYAEFQEKLLEELSEKMLNGKTENYDIRDELIENLSHHFSEKYNG